MNDVQDKEELKKIYLTQPVASIAETTPPATSTCRSSTSDHVRTQSRRHMPPVDKNMEEHISNHRKQRYWNSWEELYLVELWRRYKDEVKINVRLPVYRKIMIAMRNRNMIVTAQDCRRKINTLNTRYKQELSRMESTGCKPEWRLFPVIHCVLQPKIKEYDPSHALLTIRKLLDKIPKPIEPPTPVFSINNDNYCPKSHPQTKPTYSNFASHQSQNSIQSPFHSANLPSVYSTYDSLVNNRLSLSHGRFEKPSILPFRNITIEKIEQLRQDNNRLAEQRDMDLKCLHMEEQKFRCFEELMRTWTEQKENELQRIQLMSARSAISIEDEENQNINQLPENLLVK